MSSPKYHPKNRLANFYQVARAVPPVPKSPPNRFSVGFVTGVIIGFVAGIYVTATAFLMLIQLWTS